MIYCLFLYVFPFHVILDIFNFIVSFYLQEYCLNLLTVLYKNTYNVANYCSFVIISRQIEMQCLKTFCVYQNFCVLKGLLLLKILKSMSMCNYYYYVHEDDHVSCCIILCSLVTATSLLLYNYMLLLRLLKSMSMCNYYYYVHEDDHVSCCIILCSLVTATSLLLYNYMLLYGKYLEIKQYVIDLLKTLLHTAYFHRITVVSVLRADRNYAFSRFPEFFTRCRLAWRLFLDMRHLTIIRIHLNSSKFIFISYSFVFQFIKSKYFTIGFLNPGSLGTRHEEFVVALENRSVDIMAINETWLRSGEEKRAPAPPGYKLRHIPRPPGVRGRGGGVGFYIRDGISTRQIKPPHSDSVEQMWLSITLGGLKLAIGTAYRPPWLGVDIFIDALTQSVGALSMFDHIILVGDFNINMLAINDTNTKKLTDFFRSLNLEQYVTLPTHFTDHSETLIDIVCSTIKIPKINVDYIPDLSSHAFISFRIRLNKPKTPSKFICYRPLKDINLDEFDAFVNCIQWEKLIGEDINESILCFNAYILHVFDVYAPVGRAYIKRPSFPWITPTIKQMMSLRDKAHVKCRRTGKDADIKYYKELKSIVNKAMYSEKAGFFRKNINQHTKDPKLLWNNIKRNIVDFKSKQSVIPSHISDPDIINSHFLLVPGNDNATISDLTYFEYHRFGSSSFSLHTVDESYILKIVTSISTNAMGVDGISRDMIILTMPRTLKVITTMINMSIRTGIFPDIWKEALVKPIPKTTTPSELKDLRPISILPFLSKIIEKVVCQQLTDYLNANNILPSKQSGFRAGRSTATALLDVVDDILAGQDIGHGSILTLLDFSRAFDTINHNLLLSKLSFYGFDSGSLRWFASYLDGRSQRVEVVGVDGTSSCSKPSPISRGVPQGSILGPILFILYSTDLIGSIKDCNYHLYADDLQIYLQFKPSETLTAVNKINEDLERIDKWANRNGLVLNPLKSKFLVLGSATQISSIEKLNPAIKIGDTDVEKVTEARNLGVLMDNRLRFHNHVLEIVRNCYYRLSVLYKIRMFLDVNIRIKLCEALILSKLNYADTVMGECLFGYTKKLIQRVQNSCARFCFTIPPRSHITPFLNHNNLINMQSRRSLHYACLLFGVIQNKSPSYLYDKLLFSNRIRTASLLCCPSHSTAAFRGSFRYSATKCWNNIPPPLKKCFSLFSFKYKYKGFLLNLQKDSL